MDFNLNEEHRMLQGIVREFVEKEVAPRARHVDETGEFPWDTLRAMGKLGFLGLNVPEQYGGAGADALSAALLLEEIGRGCGSTGLIVAAHLGLACGPLALFGAEAQKKRWLVPMAQGQILGCLGLTEAGAGCDLRGIRTTAVRDGDGWRIDGSKMWLTNGAEAGLAILLCRTGDGFSHFLIPTDAPGVGFGPPEQKMGLHGSHTYAVSLDDVRVPGENLLGVEGRGLAQTLQVLDGGRVGIASLSLGLAQAAYAAARTYARTRQTFGHALNEHQAIAFMLADMVTEIEAARWLVYRAATLRDQGRPYTKEAAIAKLFTTEMAERVARNAIQIHGGYGYSQEYPVERIYRDARLMTIGEGTSEMQRLVIARHVA
ncbi:MAG: acyl-CoA dehydrogenase [Chloroflexi bacterium HGW-Chloroflexi-1]|nr:MAG: acyl-CoA dehydrogenase [Chloroflexi bacterium HGW-Chloroflexi-1]